jgi:16S rRNA (guanine966-N2)-methyltransferase
VREAVANRVEHLTGGLAGSSVLDLFAGTGAMGFELLSRGAAKATFVERDRTAVTGLRRAAADLGADGAVIMARDAAGAAGALTGAGFDIVFADPPYDVPMGAIAAILSDLIASGAAAAETLVVVETSSRVQGSPWPAGITVLPAKDYGDTRVWYGRVTFGPTTGRSG